MGRIVGALPFHHGPRRTEAEELDNLEETQLQVAGLKLQKVKGRRTTLPSCNHQSNISCNISALSDVFELLQMVDVVAGHLMDDPVHRQLAVLGMREAERALRG